MKMTGMFHLALLPGTDEQEFVEHMTQSVFTDVSALQATRITRSMRHELLHARGEFRTYVWLVTVELVTDREYDFYENIDNVRKAVEASAVVTGLDVYVNLESESPA